MTDHTRRPVLRYHGGKWRVAPWILSHFPDHEIYVEPFGGAASVLMRKERSAGEVYNDLDNEIVNLFAVLRDPESAAALRDAIYLTPYARTEFFAAYDPSPDPVEQARRTLVKHTMSHGTTGIRKHRTGFRSKCWAHHRNEALSWRDFPDEIGSFVERLRGVVIECRPALEVITQHDSPATLFFVDPPYMHATRSSVRCAAEAQGGRGYAFEMTDADHADLLDRLLTIKGMAIVCSYDNDLYGEKLGTWSRYRRTVRADGAQIRTEVLWLSPRATARQAQLSFSASGGEQAPK